MLIVLDAVKKNKKEIIYTYMYIFKKQTFLFSLRVSMSLPPECSCCCHNNGKGLRDDAMRSLTF